MAIKKNARAHIRLTLEHAEVRLNLEDGSYIKCALKDLSEGGCRCTVPLKDLDAAEVEKWQERFSKAQTSQVEFQIPPEKHVFKITAKILNTNKSKSADFLELGIRFEKLEDEDQEILRNALMKCAAKKLRDTGMYTPVQALPAVGAPKAEAPRDPRLPARPSSKFPGTRVSPLKYSSKPSSSAPVRPLGPQRPMDSSRPAPDAVTRARPPKQIAPPVEVYRPAAPMPAGAAKPKKDRGSKRFKVPGTRISNFPVEHNAAFASREEPLPGMVIPRSAKPTPIIPTPAGGTDAIGLGQHFPHRGKELPDVLVMMGLLAPMEAQDFKEKAAGSGRGFDNFILQSGRVAPFQIAQAWGLQSGLPVVDLSRITFNPNYARAIPYQTALQFECIPFVLGRRMALAASRPLATRLLDELSQIAQVPLEIHLAPADQIQQWLTMIAPTTVMTLPGAFPMQINPQGYRGQAGARPVPQPQMAPPPPPPAPQVPARGFPMHHSPRVCEVDFTFCDNIGQSLISEVFSGFVVSLDGNTLQIEGPYWSGGLPMDPVHGTSYLNMVLNAPPHPEIRMVCQVQSVTPSTDPMGNATSLIFQLELFRIDENDHRAFIQFQNSHAIVNEMRVTRRMRPGG